MKMKLAVAAISAALAAAVSVGASLAFFTNSSSSTNVVTMGNVQIKLNDAYTDPGIVMPGAAVPQTVSVTNTGSSPAYVRVKVGRCWTRNPGGAAALGGTDPGLIEIAVSHPDDWVLSSDGYYYYQRILGPSQTSSALFDHYTLAPATDNNYAGLSGRIDLSAQAVQSDNFVPGTTGNAISGWNGITVGA